MDHTITGHHIVMLSYAPQIHSFARSIAHPLPFGRNENGVNGEMEKKKIAALFFFNFVEFFCFFFIFVVVVASFVVIFSRRS